MKIESIMCDAIGWQCYGRIGYASYAVVYWGVYILFQLLRIRSKRRVDLYKTYTLLRVFYCSTSGLTLCVPIASRCRRIDVRRVVEFPEYAEIWTRLGRKMFFWNFGPKLPQSSRKYASVILHKNSWLQLKSKNSLSQSTFVCRLFIRFQMS